MGAALRRDTDNEFQGEDRLIKLTTVQPADANGQKRVLILEDDSAFREVMAEFLGLNGWDVVAVNNGVEGVHKVMANNFDIVLCDMNMPALPGDMFYRAVERMRPSLCDRFVFMTGYRGNSKANSFLEQIGATVLAKPFAIDDALEVFAFVQLRSMVLCEAA